MEDFLKTFFVLPWKNSETKILEKKWDHKTLTYHYKERISKNKQNRRKRWKKGEEEGMGRRGRGVGGPNTGP